MFAQITVAIDGADVSLAPLHCALNTAAQYHAVLTGVYVVDNQWADFIGHDWQSTARSRQDFLDYVQREQLNYLTRARDIFHHAIADMTTAHFVTRVGDPTQLLQDIVRTPTTDLLILSRQVFAAAGRPSIKQLPQRIIKHARCPVWLFP